MVAHPTFASWRERKENFEQILDTTSPSIALPSLQFMPGWRGTGFRATTLLRCFYSLDVERRKHLAESQLVFPAAHNLSTLVSVGPNPRCLLNLWKGNPWRSNKNSDPLKVLGSGSEQSAVGEILFHLARYIGMSQEVSKRLVSGS